MDKPYISKKKINTVWLDRKKKIKSFDVTKKIPFAPSNFRMITQFET